MLSKPYALFGLVVIALGGFAPPQDRVSVFVYSRDSFAGFEDERLDTFRREVGKFSESFAEIAYSASEADVRVHFLGQGRLEVELGSEGEPERYLWEPDEKAETMWAVLRIGDFSKEFSVKGRGGRDLSELAKSAAEWIQQNAAAIREKPLRD